MTIEYVYLRNKPLIFVDCPKCGSAFRQMMRGSVQRSRRWFCFGPLRPYCAVICVNCKNIVGWESP